MIIKHVTDKTIDVFVKRGWDNWTRFEIKGTYLKKVAGVSLSPMNMAMLKERLYGN